MNVTKVIYLSTMKLLLKRTTLCIAFGTIWKELVLEAKLIGLHV